MNQLHRRALAGLLSLLAIMMAALLLPAWTVHYWQGWVFLGLFFASSLAITRYLARKDPKLLERRVQAGATAEKETSQKIIQSYAGLAFIALMVIPGLDRRFAWSNVPVVYVLSGDVLVLCGFLIVFLVFKENTYTSGIIEVAAGHKVIASGPYALVRHPMYSGALVMLLGVPLALGSWWGLLLFIPMFLVIMMRLLDEEKFLLINLPGYVEYYDKVQFRLVPFIW
jgi:protein-S-isoprenylcysteine O-methyltransferase Ste14